MSKQNKTGNPANTNKTNQSENRSENKDSKSCK